MDLGVRGMPGMLNLKAHKSQESYFHLYKLAVYGDDCLILAKMITSPYVQVEKEIPQFLQPQPFQLQRIHLSHSLSSAHHLTAWQYKKMCFVDWMNQNFTLSMTKK